MKKKAWLLERILNLIKQRRKARINYLADWAKQNFCRFQRIVQKRLRSKREKTNKFAQYWCSKAVAVGF